MIYYMAFGEILPAGRGGKFRAGKIAPILPAGEANHSAGYDLSGPLTDLTI